MQISESERVESVRQQMIRNEGETLKLNQQPRQYTYVRPENEKFVQQRHENQEFIAHNPNIGNSGRKYN